MAKAKHIKLTEDGVITQEALLAYASGSLSEPERAQMDKLLLDDPFAQDALEGMRQAPKPGEINAAVTSINMRLREQSGVRERKKKGIEIHWSTYAYAAVILAVLIGLGFIMINYFGNKNSDDIAMNKPAPQGQESIPVSEEPKKDEPKTDTAQQVPTDTIKNITSIKNDTVKAIKAIIKIDSATQKKQLAQAKKENEQAADKISNTSSAITKPNTVVSAETAAQLAVARNFFEAGNYMDAEKKYNQILSGQPDNVDALYFGGISSFLNGSKGLGENNFDKLLKYGSYPDGTKWYKANILIKKGKKDQAKQLLRDLVNSNSMFKDRAVRQYEELYK
jgi:tetratricopeptide (TPR) repeat protein